MGRLKTKIKEKLIKQAQEPGHVRQGLSQAFSPMLDYMAGTRPINEAEQLWQAAKQNPDLYSREQLRQYRLGALKAQSSKALKYGLGIPVGLAGAYHLGIPAARAGMEAGGDLLSAGKNLVAGDHGAALEAAKDFAEPGFSMPLIGGAAGMAGGAGLGHAMSRGKPWGSRLGALSGMIGGAALGSGLAGGSA